MPFGSLGGPVRGGANKTVVVKQRFLGGGAAANMTKVPKGGRGVASVTYNAATGKYVITFDQVGANFLGADLTCTNSTGVVANQLQCAPVAYNAAAKTLTVFITDNQATPLAKDLPNTEELWIDAAWSDSDQP